MGNVGAGRGFYLYICAGCGQPGGRGGALEKQGQRQGRAIGNRAFGRAEGADAPALLWRLKPPPIWGKSEGKGGSTEAKGVSRSGSREARAKARLETRLRQTKALTRRLLWRLKPPPTCKGKRQGQGQGQGRRQKQKQRECHGLLLENKTRARASTEARCHGLVLERQGQRQGQAIGNRAFGRAEGADAPRYCGG